MTSFWRHNDVITSCVRWAWLMQGNHLFYIPVSEEKEGRVPEGAPPCNITVTHLHERIVAVMEQTLGLYSLSGKMSYRQILWSLEAARLDVAMVVSL